jgi:hypothetical protein
MPRDGMQTAVVSSPLNVTLSRRTIIAAVVVIKDARSIQCGKLMTKHFIQLAGMRI